MDDLARWLESNGYARASTVRDVGDYASRGGILDLYPPGAAAPIRLDFFGDTLESIRAFDPETQRSTGQLRSLDLVPMSEARLTTDSIKPLPPGLRGRVRRARRPATIFTPRSAKAAARSASNIGCRSSTKASTRSSTMSATRRSCSTRGPRTRRTSASRSSPTITPPAARPTRKIPAKADYKPLPPHAALSRAKTSGRSGSPRSRWRGSRPSKRRRAQPTSSIAAGGRGAISRPSGRTRAPTCSTPRSRMCGRCARGA